MRTTQLGVRYLLRVEGRQVAAPPTGSSVEQLKQKNKFGTIQAADEDDVSHSAESWAQAIAYTAVSKRNWGNWSSLLRKQ